MKIERYQSNNSDNLYYKCLNLKSNPKLYYFTTGDTVGEKEIMRTLPDGQPIATVDCDTAEHEGRYSEGSQSTFQTCQVIHD